MTEYEEMQWKLAFYKTMLKFLPEQFESVINELKQKDRIIEELKNKKTKTKIMNNGK